MRKKILIIEDNVKNQKLFATILDESGYQVFQARDAATGIIQAQKEQPDLILMDIQMPGMNGLDAIKLLKQNPDTAAIPVVALTALAMMGDKERILASGFDEYLSKPVNYKLLLSTVESLLVKP